LLPLFSKTDFSRPDPRLFARLFETEYVLLRELLQARKRSGLTQAEVAKKMGTKAPAVTRLETALSDNRQSPTLATLKKYAQAVGCKLEVHLVFGK
jgi:transcriptional regulator with XRE-family HTH domain